MKLLLSILLLYSSITFAAKTETRFPASDDGTTRGILHHVGQDGVITSFLGEAKGDLEAAFRDAYKKCVAKGFAKASCDKRNNFDFTIPVFLFTKQ